MNTSMQFLWPVGIGYGRIVYLPLPVDPDDTRGGLMWCSDKDGLATDSVHIDAGASL